MRCLTLTQPYASLMAIIAKTIETRSWGRGYRGPLGIHAAATYAGVGGKQAYLHLCHKPTIYAALVQGGLVPPTYDEAALLALPLGAVVAVGNLVGCVAIPHAQFPITYRQWTVPPPEADVEYALGNYTPGRVAWLVDRIHPLPTPIHVRGAMGLWPWEAPPDVQRLLPAISMTGKEYY